MENAGLITYGEYLMLFGDKPPLNQQRSFAGVHAHELAHQWFGDSVTMPWWDDLWLNEAFATFMSSKIVQQWRPSYRASEGLVHSALATMDADGLASARRIREPIADFNDITNAFDGITYEKGARRAEHARRLHRRRGVSRRRASASQTSRRRIAPT